MSAIKKIKKIAITYESVAGENPQSSKDIKWNKYHKNLYKELEKAKTKVNEGEEEFKAIQEDNLTVKKPKQPDFAALAADAGTPEGLALLQKATNDYAKQKAAYDAFTQMSSDAKKEKKAQDKKKVDKAKTSLDKLKSSVQKIEQKIENLDTELHTLGEQFEGEHKFKDLKQKAEFAARSLFVFANKATSSHKGNVVHYAHIPHLFHSKESIVAVKVDDLQKLVKDANKSIDAFTCNFNKETIAYDEDSIKEYCEAQNKTLDGDDADVKWFEDDFVYKYKDKGGNWKKVADKVEWSYEQNSLKVAPEGNAAAELSLNYKIPSPTDDDEDDEDVADSPSAGASSSSRSGKRTRSSKKDPSSKKQRV